MSDQEYAVRPNKTQLKREIRRLNDLGKELIAMSDSALKKMPLSDTMRQEINDAKRFQRGALQRQLRRIAGLMQHEDVEAIQLEITKHKQPSKQHTEELHKLEQWRQRLLDGDDKLFTELVDQFPEIDRQYVNQLVRNANLEKKRDKPPKSSRRLFKYLAEIQKNTDKSDSNETTESN